MWNHGWEGYNQLASMSAKCDLRSYSSDELEGQYDQSCNVTSSSIQAMHIYEMKVILHGKIQRDTLNKIDDYFTTWRSVSPLKSADGSTVTPTRAWYSLLLLSNICWSHEDNEMLCVITNVVLFIFVMLPWPIRLY